MTPETAQKILDEVYRNGDRMAILKELDPELRNGYVSVLCPDCRQRRAYAYQPGGKTPHVIRCNRQENCGYQATLVQYAAGTDKPRGPVLFSACTV
ncbi:MAG: hypothetical protein KKD44_17355 [Proteobacteria bacterium]|nr:hypothetical protein [Pseudomonadota bacterium]